MSNWSYLNNLEPGKSGLKRNQFSRPRIIIFAAAFALIGYLIIHSFAINPNLPGDLNDDNTVNITDLSILLSNYGATNSSADINGDGTVNVLDLSILLSHYGQNYTPPAVSCTTTITNANNFINTYNAAHAGDTICLGPGVVIDQGQIDFRNAIGTSSAPVTIASADNTNPGELLGRLVTHPPANYITFSHIKINVKTATTAASITVGSDHISFVHTDISNNNTGICMNMLNDTTYGTAHYTLVDSNRIHNCGPAGDNTTHGIYDVGFYSTIINNFIYDNSARGIQLRGAQGDTVKYNTVDGNGEGLIFGELTASNNNVYDNIFSNSIVRYNVETYWDTTVAPIGSNNKLYDSCIWATNANSYYDTNGGIAPSMTSVTVTNMKNADPMYVNRAAKDFRLQAGSACAGYGVQPTVTPGV